MEGFGSTGWWRRAGGRVAVVEVDKGGRKGVLVNVRGRRGVGGEL